MTRAFPDVTRPAVAKPAGGIDAAVADVPGFAPAHGRHVGGIDPERATDRRRTPAARPSLGATAWLELRCSASGARHATGPYGLSGGGGSIYPKVDALLRSRRCSST